MVGKAPGFVPCAHCGEPGGSAACPACHGLVCPACLGDPDTCSVAHAWSVDYPDLVVHAIDGTGSFGLVSRRPRLFQRWFGAVPAVGVLDLVSRRWMLEPAVAYQRGLLAHVSRDGAGLWQHSEGDPTGASLALANHPVDITFEVELTRFRPLRDDSGAWCIRDNLFVRYDLGREQLDRIPGLPQRLAVEAIDFDPATGVLVIGTWGRLHAFSVADKVALQASFDIGEVDVAEVVLRGRRAVIALAPVGGASIRYYTIDGAIERGARLHPEAPVRDPLLCDISADGRWVALACRGGRVTLFDLATKGAATLLEDHDARLTVVRFTDGDQRLITADEDGRVVVRPRDGDGWCARVVSRGGEGG